MATEEKKVEGTPDAPATTTPKPGLEGFTAEQLEGLYAKSPELFSKIVKPAVPKVEGEKAQEGAAQPEDFKLNMPEGVPVDEEALKKVKAIMGDKKLDNTQKLQKIVDLQAEEYKKVVKASEERNKKYEQTLKDDPDFGAAYDENIEFSKQGLLKFDKSGEVAKRLVEIGAHKDPVITRYLRDVGKASGEASTKRPDNGPTKEAEAKETMLKSRYDKSPGMFDTPQPQ